MDLALEVAEHPVGGFKLDLLGQDLTTNEVVIVENQLETSDHAHLGQILTYAAGTNATTIIWVAAKLRPEHRAAIDWLNSRTGEGTRFFGVEIGVVRIGRSDPAPTFQLVAQPNDWEKTVRTATREGAPTPRQALYVGFWTRWIERMRSERLGWSRASRAPRSSWFPTPSGISGVQYYTSFTRQGLSSELVFEDPDSEVNAARLDALRAQRQVFSDHCGGSLVWETVSGRVSTRIAQYRPEADVQRESEWDDYLDWLIDSQARLREAVAAAGGIPRV